jgi:hypothetical protein
MHECLDYVRVKHSLFSQVKVDVPDAASNVHSGNQVVLFALPRLLDDLPEQFD